MPGTSAAGREQLRIFIAEDHVAIREVLIAYLRPHPRIKVVGEAGNGRDALEAVRLNRPDVLVLDIDLPELNGIEVTRTLMSEYPDLKILIFTAHYDPATVRRVLEAGARGMIEKAGSADSLVKAIELVGAGRAYFGNTITDVLQKSFTEPTPTRSDDNLTSREREVLQMVAEGMINKEISQRLGISVKTVENHRHSLMSKLGAHNAADLTREAYRLGFLQSNKTALPDPN